MGAVLGTAALAVAALGVVLAGLCFVPVDYAVSAHTERGIEFRVRWLFGLLRFGNTGRRARRRVRAGARGPREAGRGSRLRRARRARALLSIDGLLPRAGRLLGETLRALGWRHGRVAVRAGTGDPASTGELCGVVGPVLVWLPSRPALRVTFEPEFAEAVFEAHAAATGTLVPARLVGALGRFALSRPGRRAIGVLTWNRGL